MKPLKSKMAWMSDYRQKEKFHYFSEEDYNKSLLLENKSIDTQEIIGDLNHHISSGLFPYYIHLFQSKKVSFYYILEELPDKKDWIDIRGLSLSEIEKIIYDLIRTRPTGRFITISFSSLKNLESKKRKFIPNSIQVIGYNPYDLDKDNFYSVYKEEK